MQLTISDGYLQISGESTKILELLDALDKSGVKHAHRFTRDPNIKDGEIVLWVGPKSPKDINPDQCAGAQLKQKPGEPHTCDLIAQTTGVCPFVPQSEVDCYSMIDLDGTNPGSTDSCGHLISRNSSTFLKYFMIGSLLSEK